MCPGTGLWWEVPVSQRLNTPHIGVELTRKHICLSQRCQANHQATSACTEDAAIHHEGALQHVCFTLCPCCSTAWCLCQSSWLSVPAGEGSAVFFTQPGSRR